MVHKEYISCEWVIRDRKRTDPSA